MEVKMVFAIVVIVFSIFFFAVYVCSKSSGNTKPTSPPYRTETIKSDSVNSTLQTSQTETKKLSNEDIYHTYENNTLSDLEFIWGMAGCTKSFEYNRYRISKFLNKTFENELKLLHEAGLTTGENKENHFELCVGVIYLKTFAYSYYLIQNLQARFIGFSDDIIASALMGTLMDMEILSDNLPSVTAIKLKSSSTYINDIIRNTIEKAKTIQASGAVSDLKSDLMEQLTDAELNNDIPEYTRLRKKYYDFLCKHPVLGKYYQTRISYELFEQITDLLKASTGFSQRGEYIPVCCWGFKIPVEIIYEWLEGGYSVFELSLVLTQYFDGE